MSYTDVIKLSSELKNNRTIKVRLILYLFFFRQAYQGVDKTAPNNAKSHNHHNNCTQTHFTLLFFHQGLIGYHFSILSEKA